MTRFDISNYQGTVTRSIKFAGVGLHTGKLVELDVSPAAPNSGIQFMRTDVPNPQPILAHPDNITSTTLCTTIGNQNYSVSTIEHLMAAFAGLGIDNALVQVNVCELPILDGSAAPFVDKLNEVGIQIQSTKRKVIIPNKLIEVESGDQYMRLEPFDHSQSDQAKNPHLEINCSIDFPFSRVIGKQTIKVNFSRRNFMDLCEARTFCHVDDVEMMRRKGLAQGGSLDNAVVVNHEKVMNNDGLRYDDEFVRHKLLDCIGDLALLGGRLTGRLTLHKAGHGLHAQFTKKVLEDDTCTTIPCAFEDKRINAVEGMGLAAMAKKEP
ncbi:MAG: UDP-3-O-[3-hydroxymyristoyl] N-acetylglucosamine deacetylase [Oligoflexales bacterium]|nr:UDP-3-O-[3-hydroxymyristoyl] N-acetylglucosamine deacetylase [Oligoflexales bacterium]